LLVATTNVYELNDLMFLVECLKLPSIYKICHKLYQIWKFPQASTFQIILIHALALFILIESWNHLPVIDTFLYQLINLINLLFIRYIWKEFSSFNWDLPCTMHIVCPCFQCSVLPVSVNFQSFNLVNNLIQLHFMHTHHKSSCIIIISK